jgi:hypothetical protein
MLHQGMVGWAIHTDRVRDIERAVRDHRLLTANDDAAPVQEPTKLVRVAQSTNRPACGYSAGQPA